MGLQEHEQTLGLKRNPKEAEIRAAYKSLALKWHPDKHFQHKDHAANKFRQITEAYKALMNAVIKTNADYEEGGANLGGCENSWGLWPEGSPDSKRRRVADIFQTLDFTLRDSFFGARRFVRYHRRVLQSGELTEREASVEVIIPKGAVHGAQIRCTEVGDEDSESHRAGDLVVILREEVDDAFIRSADDLVCTAVLMHEEAIRGRPVLLRGVDGEVVPVPYVFGMLGTPEFTVVVAGMGMPRLDAPGRGDIIVHFTVLKPAGSGRYEVRTKQEPDDVQFSESAPASARPTTRSEKKRSPFHSNPASRENSFHKDTFPSDPGSRENSLHLRSFPGTRTNKASRTAPTHGKHARYASTNRDMRYENKDSNTDSDKTKDAPRHSGSPGQLFRHAYSVSSPGVKMPRDPATQSPNTTTVKNTNGSVSLSPSATVSPRATGTHRAISPDKNSTSDDDLEDEQSGSGSGSGSGSCDDEELRRHASRIRKFKTGENREKPIVVLHSGTDPLAAKAVINSSLNQTERSNSNHGQDQLTNKADTSIKPHPSPGFTDTTTEKQELNECTTDNTNSGQNNAMRVNVTSSGVRSPLGVMSPVGSAGNSGTAKKPFRVHRSSKLQARARTGSISVSKSENDRRESRAGSISDSEPQNASLDNASLDLELEGIERRRRVSGTHGLGDYEAEGEQSGCSTRRNSHYNGSHVMQPLVIHTRSPESTGSRAKRRATSQVDSQTLSGDHRDHPLSNPPPLSTASPTSPNTLDSPTIASTTAHLATTRIHAPSPKDASNESSNSPTFGPASSENDVPKNVPNQNNETIGPNNLNNTASPSVPIVPPSNRDASNVDIDQKTEVSIIGGIRMHFNARSLQRLNSAKTNSWKPPAKFPTKPVSPENKPEEPDQQEETKTLLGNEGIVRFHVGPDDSQPQNAKPANSDSPLREPQGPNGKPTAPITAATTSPQFPTSVRIHSLPRPRKSPLVGGPGANTHPINVVAHADAVTTRAVEQTTHSSSEHTVKSSDESKPRWSAPFSRKNKRSIATTAAAPVAPVAPGKPKTAFSLSKILSSCVCTTNSVS